MIELNAEGYNLIEGNHNVWYLQVVGVVAYSGTFGEVVAFAIYRLGFTTRELEDAVQDMVREGHNAAHFGTFKRFIYSFEQDLKPNRKVA